MSKLDEINRALDGLEQDAFEEPVRLQSNPTLPSKFQVGDRVMLPGMITQVSFSEGKALYDIVLLDGDDVEYTPEYAIFPLEEPPKPH